MPKVKASIVKFISKEPQPGIVEVAILDASGKELKIEDKASVFSNEQVTAQSPFPIDIYIECTILDKDSPNGTVRISLKPWSLETIDGTDELVVDQNSLIDL